MNNEDVGYIHNTPSNGKKKKKVWPFATWMELEDIVLSEISQRKIKTI